MTLGSVGPGVPREMGGNVWLAGEGRKRRVKKFSWAEGPLGKGLLGQLTD